MCLHHQKQVDQGEFPKYSETGQESKQSWKEINNFGINNFQIKNKKNKKIKK